ncbi:MAG: DegT/DnrJ/EryC1/StrS family aminotransferase [Proteobacteria bacterium]|nr:DegT/DnrJ/EryC1/StrS family aminotransferase [Pseudomonadota bacterium]
MKVPLLDLKAQYAPLKEEISKTVLEIMDSQYFIGGPYLKECEVAVSKYSRAKHCVGCSSGSDAIIISLLALGIKPGDEVIVPSFTFFATAGAVAIIGAKPVFVDVLEDTFNMDYRSVEKAITNKTKAIIAVDLYGQTADLDKIQAIAKKNKIGFIEDAAQSIGAEYKGKRVGEVAELTTISFYPAKNLGAFGDAGAVLTNDDRLKEKLVMLREHGSSDRYYHKMVGMNARLDAIQAAIVLKKLKKLDDWTQGRQKNAKIYYDLFEEAGLGDLVITPKVADYSTRHIFNQFVIRTKKRDELKTYLQNKEIASAVFYPLGLHMQECFRFTGSKEGDLPVTEKLCHEVLALPIYPELTREQLGYVVDNIRDFYRN